MEMSLEMNLIISQRFFYTLGPYFPTRNAQYWNELQRLDSENTIPEVSIFDFFKIMTWKLNLRSSEHLHQFVHDSLDYVARSGCRT